MRGRIGKFVGVMVALVCVLGMGWSGVLAQGTFDPAALAAAQAGAIEVAGLMRPHGGQQVLPPVAAVVTPEAVPSEEVTPEVTVEATEEVTPTETSEAVPTVDITSIAQHEEGGVTIQAPAEWSIEPGIFGSVFDIVAPDTDLFAVLQSSEGEDFPGIVGVVLFRAYADALVSSLGEGVELVSVDSEVTDQLLPVTKIVFAGPIEGEDDAVGAFYVVSPGADAYILIAYAPAEQWEALEPGIDLIGQSLFFDEELITLMTAEGGELAYEDPDGVYEIAVPEGWQVTDIDTEQFTVGVVDPEFNVVGLVAAVNELEPEAAMLLASILAGADVDQATLDDFIASFGGVLGGDESFEIDHSQTQTFITDKGAVVRIVAAMQMDETTTIDVVFYLGLSVDGTLVLMTIGNPESVQAQEDTLVGMLESLEFVP